MQWEWVVRTCTWDMRLTHTFDLLTPCCSTTTTVGAAKNETLVFVDFSAKDASKLKISVPIIKRRSWGFQNTPNLQILHDFKLSYGNLKEIKMSKNNFDWRFREGKSKHCFFGCSITWLKIIQTLKVGGCFEILGTSSWWWAQRFLKLMHLRLSNSRKTESAVLIGANCNAVVALRLAVVVMRAGLQYQNWIHIVHVIILAFIFNNHTLTNHTYWAFKIKDERFNDSLGIGAGARIRVANK